MAAEPDSVRLARREVMRWFHEGHSDEDRLAAAVALATTEAVGNVVRHAYPNGSGGRVDIAAQLQDGEIVVVVSDRGFGLATHPEDTTSGLGLPVIGRVSDGVTVDSDSDGTSVTMRFRLRRMSERRATFRPIAGRSHPIAAH